MPYEDILKEYLDENPERKVKLFKLYTRLMIISTLAIGLGVILYIFIAFGIFF